MVQAFGVTSTAHINPLVLVLSIPDYDIPKTDTYDNQNDPNHSRCFSGYADFYHGSGIISSIEWYPHFDVKGLDG